MRSSTDPRTCRQRGRSRERPLPWCSGRSTGVRSWGLGRSVPPADCRRYAWGGPSSRHAFVLAAADRMHQLRGRTRVRAFASGLGRADDDLRHSWPGPAS